ncbi:hypothetical protein Pelo_19113 [Pelomyxa schiedti]|nr:hypothetical protein Pelo_19113 [Pelomyxa schiedti]
MKRIGFSRMQATSLEDCGEPPEKLRSLHVGDKLLGVDYSGNITVWKLQQDQRFPSDSLQVSLPRQPRLIWQGLTAMTWSKRSMISQGDEFCVVTPSTSVKSNWEVRIVDLKRTLDTGALSVVELHTIVRDENVVSEPVAVMSSFSDGSLFLPFKYPKCQAWIDSPSELIDRIELVNVFTGSTVMLPPSEKFVVVDSSHFAVGHQIFEVSNTQSPVRMEATIPGITCADLDMSQHGLICNHTYRGDTISFHDALCGQFLFSLPDHSQTARVEVQIISN